HADGQPENDDVRNVVDVYPTSQGARARRKALIPMRLLTSVTLLLLLCAPLTTQTIEAKKMAPATLAQLARTSIMQPPGELEKRPRPARATKKRAAIATDFVTVTNSIPAPPLTRGFKASFDPLPNATTGYVPPNVSGATNPHHVVGAFNNS